MLKLNKSQLNAINGGLTMNTAQLSSLRNSSSGSSISSLSPVRSSSSIGSSLSGDSSAQTNALAAAQASMVPSAGGIGTNTSASLVQANVPSSGASLFG